jgi:hypothetical protein
MEERRGLRASKQRLRSSPGHTFDSHERSFSELGGDLSYSQATGYTRRYPHNANATVVRQLGATHLQAMTWMGILRQVLVRDKK